MLTPNLKQFIDGKWDNCWPVSHLRPMAILDLMGYIYFLKKSDDHHLISKNFSSLKSGHFIFSKEIEEFTWSKFRDMDAAVIHDLFTRQFGILDLMNEYGKSGFLYSRFFEPPLLLKPTSKLLLNAIEIINLIESHDAATQADIIEYLFTKTQATQKEPQFIPQHISTLMVSIAELRADDLIYDFSTGAGSLLINAAAFFKKNDPVFKQDLSSRLKGFESNPRLLRIAAMRMMLHGIDIPDVEILTPANVAVAPKATVFISSLLNAGDTGNRFAEDNKSENGQLEVIQLKNILTNMLPGSRAVVLVSENLLKSFLPEIENVRKDIVDNTNLKGVIHLSPNGKSYSAAGILIFDKDGSETTNRVWFCKMEKPAKTRTINETITNPDQNDLLLSEELSGAEVVLDQWKKRKEVSSNNCFFINVYDIKTNNYNLNFNDYKLISSDERTEDATGKNKKPQRDRRPTVATKKDSLHQFYAVPARLEKRRRKRKVVPAVLLILVLIITAGWSYLYYFKDQKKSDPYGITAEDSVQAVSKMPAQTSATEPKIKPEEKKKSAAVKEMPHASGNAATTQHPSKRYTVVNKTWFHSAPDPDKRKSFYLQPRQDLVLVPTEEENGFVYVVYVNKKGESTHGWLAKKDLAPVD